MACSSPHIQCTVQNTPLFHARVDPWDDVQVGQLSDRIIQQRRRKATDRMSVGERRELSMRN
jgi:hypothetical protein